MDPAFAMLFEITASSCMAVAMPDRMVPYIFGLLEPMLLISFCKERAKAFNRGEMGSGTKTHLIMEPKAVGANRTVGQGQN